MLPKSLLAFAASATAFLLPDIPKPEEIPEDTFKALPYETDASVLPVSARFQSVDVQCLECKGKDSHLELNFAVEDGTKLTLNGVELYPDAPDIRQGALTAAVVKGNGKQKEEMLGYALTAKLVGVDEEQQMELMDIELSIFEVGGRTVSGIPVVQTKLVKDMNQKIALGSITVRESSQAGCNLTVCRVREMLVQVLKKALKGCVGNRYKGHQGHKGHNHHSVPQQNEGTKVDANIPVSGDDADRQPEKHHGHHHNWRHLLKNIATHIFLPVLMGITAGVGVAVAAMALCTIVIRLTGFIRNRRTQGARCRRSSKKQAVHEAGADMEKVGLMEAAHEEPPPQYPDDASKN